LFLKDKIAKKKVGNMDIGLTTIKVFGINRSVKTHDKLLKTERDWV
jgi:hypothetical protein